LQCAGRREVVQDQCGVRRGRTGGGMCGERTWEVGGAQQGGVGMKAQPTKGTKEQNVAGGAFLPLHKLNVKAC